MKRATKQRRAWRLAGRAERQGRLNRPLFCEKCWRPSNVLQKHHSDYRRPLAIEWRCPKCHAPHGAATKARKKEKAGQRTLPLAIAGGSTHGSL